MEKQKKKLLCCSFWNWNKLNLNTYYYYYDDYIYDDQTHKKIILFRNKHYDYLGASLFNIKEHSKSPRTYQDC